MSVRQEAGNRMCGGEAGEQTGVRPLRVPCAMEELASPWG